MPQPENRSSAISRSATRRARSGGTMPTPGNWMGAASSCERAKELLKSKFALARPGYELGEAVLAEAGERWCPDARCGAAVNGNGTA